MIAVKFVVSVLLIAAVSNFVYARRIVKKNESEASAKELKAMPARPKLR